MNKTRNLKKKQKVEPRPLSRADLDAQWVLVNQRFADLAQTINLIRQVEISLLKKQEKQE
ncbi:MAG: hypothetical protein ACE5H1_10620 [Thermodesulfobacteriota bacterium]